MDHPMHLHGHHYHVLGTSGVNAGNYDHARDGASLNLENPVFKNTMPVPRGGWTVLQLYAYNPGAWFFHCHIEYHSSRGMQMVVEVGAPDSWPWTLPSGMPLCANSAADMGVCSP